MTVPTVDGGASTNPTDAPEATQGEQPKEVTKVEDLPQWAQDEIRNLRSEAASYRTGNRELRDQLSKAKSPEDFEALVNDYTTKITGLELEIAKRDAAASAGLPPEFAARLKGNTPEELANDAKDFAAKLPKAPTPPASLPAQHPAGGKTPEVTKPLSPRDAAAAYRDRYKR